MDKIPWWKKTTVYQVYPRSFMDSTGNGIGDLKGIISKLDYIKELGIETIWFSPFFKSPQQDMGYDISDFRDIAQEYGDLDDCTELIEQVHARDMKIVFDLVLNHTSALHPWFVESRSSLDSPKRDWYIWRKGRGGKPPNNWTSMVGGSAWHYDANTDEYYYAAFLDFQPDLNYRNPEVKQAMFDNMRFWLDKGVDGFRLDIIGSVFEDIEFRDNPRTFQLLPTSDERGMLFRSAEMTLNLEDNFEFVRELRQLVDIYKSDRFLVGEVFGDYRKMQRYCVNGLHSVFLFQTMETKFSKSAYSELISEFETYFKEPLIPTWVYSNHDRFRSIHRLNNSVERAKLLAALQLTLRGVPYIYYGEELGMHQSKFSFKESKDAIAQKYKWIPSFLTGIVMKMTDGALNRDGCRTPMQWDTSLNAGFSSGDHTWLPVNDNYTSINVECLKEDANSLLNCFKRFLRFRNNNSELQYGSLDLIENGNKYILEFHREHLIVLANFSDKQQKYRVPQSVILESTDIDRERVELTDIVLKGYELIILHYSR